MINLNNILDNLKDKINKLKIELLNTRNDLDKINNIPTLIVILENDLTKLDFDDFKKCFSLLENNIDDDIDKLKKFKNIYEFLKDSEIENTGIKRECSDTLNNIIAKYKNKYQEIKDKLEENKINLENTIDKNTKLKEYLEKINTLSITEIEELLELINLLDLPSEELLDLICYISKISLKRVKEIDTSFVINKDNVEELIAETKENQQTVLNELEQQESENDIIYQEKVSIILNLIQQTKQILENSPLNLYMSLNENLQCYINKNDYDSAVYSKLMPTDLTREKFLEMHILIQSLKDLKECLDFNYDKETIDDAINLFNTCLDEYNKAKSFLEEYLTTIETDDKEDDTTNTDLIIEDDDKKNEIYTDTDEIIKTEIIDLPTFLNSTKNIILLGKSQSNQFLVDYDLISEDQKKQTEKQQGFIRTLQMFKNQTYEGRNGIKATFSRPTTKKIDKLYKSKDRKKYDTELNPYRLRTYDRIRTGYLIIPVCQENRKKIAKLYKNNEIMKDGSIILIFGVIWTEANHARYEKLNENLYVNEEYIKNLINLFSNPSAKEEDLKAIIDESMERCLKTLETPEKEDSHVRK